MKGYKVLNPNWTCRDVTYQIGETKTIDGEIKLCERGFHFCLNPADCFSYYSFDSKNIVVEVEALGVSEETKDDSKRVCSSITILRQLTWEEVLRVVNTGSNNTGLKNSGNWNSGHGNSGHRNSGDLNGGNLNGGNRNSGDRNSGNWNSGHWNSGDRNSGHWNSGNWNSGSFNSVTPKLLTFNKECNLSFYEFNKLIPYLDIPTEMCWVPEMDMSDKEKNRFPNYKTLGGYLKKVDIPFKEGVKSAWDKQTKENKEKWLKLPNFDADIFLEITGVDVRLDKDLQEVANE